MKMLNFFSSGVFLKFTLGAGFFIILRHLRQLCWNLSMEYTWNVCAEYRLSKRMINEHYSVKELRKASKCFRQIIICHCSTWAKNLEFFQHFWHTETDMWRCRHIIVCDIDADVHDILCWSIEVHMIQPETSIMQLMIAPSELLVKFIQQWAENLCWVLNCAL